MIRYPNGIDWNGNPVKFVIGIAGADDDHLELLGKIAEVFLDADRSRPSRRPAPARRSPTRSRE